MHKNNRSQTFRKMQETEKSSGPYYWLDPQKKKIGEYWVHEYYYEPANSENEENDKFVYKLRLLASIPCSLVANFNCVEFDYMYKPARRYIGDTEPDAKGFLAFLVKHLSQEEIENNQCEPGWEHSLLEILNKGGRFDIMQWFKKYFTIQEHYFSIENNKKTPGHGRLDKDQLHHEFVIYHFQKEQAYFNQSRNLNGQVKRYTKEYLDWVAKKSKDIILTYDTGYSEGQLLDVHSELISKKYLRRNDIDKKDFVTAFSRKYITAKIRFYGMKSKLSWILWEVTKQKPVPEEVKKVFCFPNHRAPFGFNNIRAADNQEKKTFINNSPPLA